MIHIGIENPDRANTMKKNSIEGKSIIIKSVKKTVNSALRSILSFVKRYFPPFIQYIYSPHTLK